MDYSSGIDVCACGQVATAYATPDGVTRIVAALDGNWHDPATDLERKAVERRGLSPEMCIHYEPYMLTIAARQLLYG